MPKVKKTISPYRYKKKGKPVKVKRHVRTYRETSPPIILINPHVTIGRKKVTRIKKKTKIVPQKKVKRLVPVRKKKKEEIILIEEELPVDEYPEPEPITDADVIIRAGRKPTAEELKEIQLRLDKRIQTRVSPYDRPFLMPRPTSYPKSKWDPYVREYPKKISTSPRGRPKKSVPEKIETIKQARLGTKRGRLQGSALEDLSIYTAIKEAEDKNRPLSTEKRKEVYDEIRKLMGKPEYVIKKPEVLQREKSEERAKVKRGVERLEKGMVSEMESSILADRIKGEESNKGEPLSREEKRELKSKDTLKIDGKEYPVPKTRIKENVLKLDDVVVEEKKKWWEVK